MIKKKGKRYRKSASITKKIHGNEKRRQMFRKKSLSEKIQPLKRGPGAHSEKKMKTRSNSEKSGGDNIRLKIKKQKILRKTSRGLSIKKCIYRKNRKGFLFSRGDVSLT